MKTAKIMSNLLFSILAALLIGSAVGSVMAAPPLVVAGGIFITGLMMPNVPGVAYMAIQREIWEADIVKNLWRNNMFSNMAYNADQYVIQGKVVHIPNAGTVPSVQKNRSSLPATVVKRTDTDITYALDEFTTDPILIPNADTVELSYDKRASYTEDAQAAIRQLVADSLLYSWAPNAAVQAIPAGSVLSTTGASTAAHASGTTGTRKAFVHTDLRRMQAAFNRQDIPDEERYCLMDADMYDQFLASLSDSTNRDFSRYIDAVNGVVGELYGFKIMRRSSVLVYNTAGTTPNAVGAANAATDNAAVICWQKNSVERALGEVQFFDQQNAPQYYGDIYSYLLRMGGRIRRADGKGVGIICQAP